MENSSMLDNADLFKFHSSISIFLAQTCMVVASTQLFSLLLQFYRQPPIMAEVLGAILLSSIGLGNIPGMYNAIFPDESIPMLSLIGKVGLILYLFLVGLELDPHKISQNFRKAWSISLAGIIVPFTLGISVSKFIYDSLHDQDRIFFSFFFFCGISFSITAYPALSWILASRKLLETQLGGIALAAAAVDDVISWILLIIDLGLIRNPGEYIFALYEILITLGWALFLFFAVKPILVAILKRSSKEHETSSLNTLMIFTLIFISSVLMESAGVHALIGSFLVGLITPRDFSFALEIAEKIEDLITLIFIPIYFTATIITLKPFDNIYLSSNFFVAVVVVIAVSSFGKFFGVFMSAKCSSLPTRECLALGVLMNTRGLLEVIVLNIGLESGLINNEIYCILLIMALTNTFIVIFP